MAIDTYKQQLAKAFHDTQSFKWDPSTGLYLVGGSAHPGGGLPLVGISGDLVTEAIGYEKNARH